MSGNVIECSSEPVMWTGGSGLRDGELLIGGAPGRSGSQLMSLPACRALQQDFVNLVCEAVECTAEAGHSIAPRALIVRALLQLPRTADRGGNLSCEQVRDELHRCAAELVKDQQNLRHREPSEFVKLDDLRFVACDDGASQDIFGNLHYLRSARAGSINYGLVDSVGRPVALCSVSPFDWTRVGRQLTGQFGIAVGAVRDVSRVFSFDLAPRNAISYLLARVRREIRRTEPEVELLTTAVDPNLGFAGASYRAANWHRWMTIKPRPYLYFDREYVSPRQLRARFGTTKVDALKAAYGARFEVSRCDLLDSMIFCCRVKGPTENVPPAQQRRLHR